MAGQTHIWEHLEDLGCDGQDAAGVHLVPQLGPCRRVPLGGEQEGGSITAPGQRRPSEGQEKHTVIRGSGGFISRGCSQVLFFTTFMSGLECLESRLNVQPFFSWTLSGLPNYKRSPSGNRCLVPHIQQYISKHMARAGISDTFKSLLVL